MNARFYDKDGVAIRQIQMSETPKFVSIPEMGEGREVVPGKAMMIAKFTLRLYKFMGIIHGVIIYQQTTKKEILNEEK